MNFFQAILVVLAPLVPIVLPGIFFTNARTWDQVLFGGSRIILWSMGTLTLSLTAGLYSGISVQIIGLLLAISGIVYHVLLRRHAFNRQTAWHLLGIAISILGITALFAIPFFIIHDGLPTGDVQKTIIWANESIATNYLPNYQTAVPLLNRDPVDFYTPGLHAISALVLSLSPAPLISIGLFSIIIAVCVAFLAASITKELFDKHAHVVPPVLAALFVLTQYRFLRYLKEPGYHFQNVVGELFLFGLLLLFVRYIRRGEKQDAALFLVCACALFLTHQFSAFIAVFMMIFMGIACLAIFRKKIVHAIRANSSLSLALLTAGTLAIIFMVSLGLHHKLPSIFTATPHLTSLLLPFEKYPATMGEFWFFAGISGIVLMIIESRRRDFHYRQVVVFGSATVAIIVLSQGPAFGIDIPPVRAMFYLVVPLSIGAAYLFGKIFAVVRYSYHGNMRFTARLAVCCAIGIAVYGSTSFAYSSISHSVRTNSTLTGGQLGLIEVLQRENVTPPYQGGAGGGGASALTPPNLPSYEGRKRAILVDDFDRKSASWLALSGAPMFTRIAADLERQMEESGQSPLRMELYLRQLDYEKIIELGSLPEIATLLSKNSIGYVTGIEGTSQSAFAHNPLLKPIGFAEDIVLYEVGDNTRACTSVECKFLMRASTLANDIGDDLDTFENLQASIRSAQVSEPIVKNGSTYREVSSPIIPLAFNVGDYVRVLWDPNSVNRPETSLAFMLWLEQPVRGLSLRTSSGEELALPYSKHIRVELQRDMVQINDKGFILLSLINPNKEPVPIDLISLGPWLIP